MGKSHPMVAKFLVDKAKLQLRKSMEDEKMEACKCLSEADSILKSAEDSSGKDNLDLAGLKKDLDKCWKKLGGREVYVGTEYFFDGTPDAVDDPRASENSVSLYASVRNLVGQ